MDSGTGEPVVGLMVGLVCDLDDPERLGRVRVTFPDLGDNVRSDWARIVAPMAGPGRGLVMLPEKGDEVMIAFERGDLRAPYVLGGVWSSTDRPPEGDGAATQNNWRFLTSRSGHVIKLDDTAGAERIEIVDKAGTCRIVVDSAKQVIKVTADSGSVEVSAGKSVSVTGGEITVSATQSLSLKSDGTVRIQGSTVDIN